jgi:hypothetical protein
LMLDRRLPPRRLSRSRCFFPRSRRIDIDPRLLRGFLVCAPTRAECRLKTSAMRRSRFSIFFPHRGNEERHSP